MTGMTWSGRKMTGRTGPDSQMTDREYSVAWVSVRPGVSQWPEIPLCALRREMNSAPFTEIASRSGRGPTERARARRDTAPPVSGALQTAPDTCQSAAAAPLSPHRAAPRRVRLAVLLVLCY